jgi:unsaturated chondroitin disaccharide hydrolase
MHTSAPSGPVRVGAVAVAILVAGAAGAAPLDGPAAERALAVAQAKLAAASARLTPDRLPKSTGPDGLWRTVAATDRVGWTQGFFPGTLWYVHEWSGDAAWRERAERFTATLEPQKTNTETHDVGFKLVPSFGNAHRLTGDPAHRDVLLAGAASLATRFRPEVGAIDCCDWNPDWRLPVVIDTMMNLELLLWAARNGGDPAHAELALQHALRTRDDLVRADGGTFHVADYEPGTGALRWRGTFQGAADGSTWARGQAWAVYGFTMVYRYTRDARMLETARRTADFFLARLPASGVPRWDLDVAGPPDDSSAAAILASALLELATHVGAPGGDAYRAHALRILGTLASPSYLDERPATEGILLHGAGNVPAGQEVDVSLAYGDYYFVEALLRARPWPAAPPAPDAGEDGADGAGTGDAGEAGGGGAGDGGADAGGADAGGADAGGADAGGADAGGADAGGADAGGADAGGGDAGGADAGGSDGSGSDGGAEEPAGDAAPTRSSGGCATGGAGGMLALLAVHRLRRLRRADAGPGPRR